MQPGRTGSSLAGALLEPPLQYHPHNPPPLLKRSPIHDIPIEILLKIFHLVALPRTRDSLYDILNLTHVCRFWRVALIDQPRVWAVLFITRKDRRSFVEACLERSQSGALDITVDAGMFGRVYPDCMCKKARSGRLFPNESDPCERHFQFESLTETKHSIRIHALDIDFDGILTPIVERAEKVERVQLALGRCWFFTLSFPQLTTLSWKNDHTMHANRPFSASPFAPTLRSLTFVGPWDSLAARVNNLTSFVHRGDWLDVIRVEDFRSFLLNNYSLELLGLGSVRFEGDSIDPPVCLSNLKSLSAGPADDKLPTIIRVPALQRLSSLRIGSDGAGYYTLYATGDGITFSVRCSSGDIARTWEKFTEYARPTIRHVCLDDSEPVECNGDHGDPTLVPVLLDVHTLEIGVGHFPDCYGGFLDDLKQLGPQLKTIRFAVPEELGPPSGSDGFFPDSELLDSIEDLVRDRFLQGRPLSAVERMVTTDSKRVNREQDLVWSCLYDSRELSKYVQPRITN